MLINMPMLKTYWKKNYFPVFQWELNHSDLLIKTASSSWETAEPMEEGKREGLKRDQTISLRYRLPSYTKT